MGKNTRIRSVSKTDKILAVLPALFALLFFYFVCRSSSSTVKITAMILACSSVITAFLFFGKLKSRLTLPYLSLALVVLLDGISSLYAVSGKFALYEFCKVLCAFSLITVLLAVAPKKDPLSWIASVLEGFSALASLVSIDLISTRAVSSLVVKILGSPEYQNLAGAEAGVRMTSLFTNPNVFAGVAGLGVLISLGLSASRPDFRHRWPHLLCLSVSAFAFILAFSMGASAVIAVAFLLMIFATPRENRGTLLILMAETLLITALCAAVTSRSSLTAWTAPRFTPLAAALLGAAALCLSERFLAAPLSKKLSEHTRVILPLTVAAPILLLVFLFLAFHLTGGIDLTAGQTLRRSAYPSGGEYTLSLEAHAPLTVTVQSQNRRDTVMHTYTVLYEGNAEGAAFTVPEDSMVVYFNFYASEDVSLSSASYRSGDGGETGKIPLNYKLLPGFISNRIQGLRANQNAIQRGTFFKDGMKLFRRSPIIGLGIGAFENGIKSVQSFFYETKYAHNHYIEALVETGVLGLLLFVALLAVSAFYVIRARRRGNPMAGALAAALVFMAGHAAVEVIFSSFPYLPIAYGVFALIGLAGAEDKAELPPAKERSAERVQTVSAVLIPLFTVVYIVLLGCNMRAAAIVERPTAANLVEAAKLDKFEHVDYELSYVVSSMQVSDQPEIRAQADAYAEKLSKINSNTVPIYLAEYYFLMGDTTRGFDMADKFADYTSSDPESWQRIFSLLSSHYEDTPEFNRRTAALADKLDAWNEANLGNIAVDDEAAKLIATARGAVS